MCELNKKSGMELYKKALARKITIWAQLNLLTEYKVRTDIHKWNMGYIRALSDLNLLNVEEMRLIYYKMHEFICYNKKFKVKIKEN